MSILNNTPENQNFQSPLNFNFFIQRAPTLNFFIQKVNLPGILLPAASQHNPFVKIPHPGDHLDYEPLRVTYKIDEDFNNYLEMHSWIRGLGSPEDLSEYKELKAGNEMMGYGITSNITLQILDSKHNLNLEAVFENAWPREISGTNFDRTSSTVNFIESTVIFDYSHYNIKKYT